MLMKKESEIKPIDLDRHVICKHFAREYSCSFQKVTGERGSIFYVDRSEYYGIVFLLEGEAVHLEPSKKATEMDPMSMIFVDKAKTDSFSFRSSCVLYYIQFTKPSQMCEAFSVNALKPYAPHEHITHPLPILKPLELALQSLIRYHQDGLKCGIVMDIKLQEIFFVLSSYYSKNELGCFLAPLLREEIDFKEFVLANYLHCASVSEMAERKGISIRLFNKLFKETFNMPPYQWMLLRKGKVIKERLARKEIPFSEIIEEFGFSSPSHFTVYCRKQFGQTPTKIRKELSRKHI